MHPKFLTNLYQFKMTVNQLLVTSIGLISGKPCQIGRPLLGYWLGSLISMEVAVATIHPIFTIFLLNTLWLIILVEFKNQLICISKMSAPAYPYKSPLHWQLLFVEGGDFHICHTNVTSTINFYPLPDEVVFGVTSDVRSSSPRRSVPILFPEQISETLAWISSILHTHIPSKMCLLGFLKFHLLNPCTALGDYSRPK